VIPNNKLSEEGKITNINLTVKYNAISDVDSLSSIPGMIAIHRTTITLYIFMADTKKSLTIPKE
jgi:hypothetical protein